MGDWLQRFGQGLWDDFSDLPDPTNTAQIIGRVLVAMILGGVLGLERERSGKEAGLRTHILVAVAAAFFVLIPQQTGMSLADLSRIIQGLAAGIGFIGAGAILKQSEQGRILGLTTAAGLYFTAAVGVAAGLGRELSAILGTGLAFVVLSLLLKVEQHTSISAKDSTPEPKAAPAAKAKRK